MNHDFLIRTTNRIAVYTTAALIYWIFVFLLITVFDLKIFREQLTESFFLSIVAIFALLGGAIVLNVMSNLSKMSAAVSMKNGSPIESSKSPTRRLVLLALSFPLIAGALFLGNELSEQRKEKMLVDAARNLVAENQDWLASLTEYEFSEGFVKRAETTLGVIKKIDKNLPEVILIVPDEIDGKKLLLAFGRRHYEDEKKAIEKSAFIFSASQVERDYLQNIYATDTVAYRFHGEDNNYQLYFPTVVAGKKIVLYFSDYQRYGKFGS
jgi:hypothetical protein